MEKEEEDQRSMFLLIVKTIVGQKKNIQKRKKSPNKDLDQEKRNLAKQSRNFEKCREILMINS